MVVFSLAYCAATVSSLWLIWLPRTIPWSGTHTWGWSRLVLMLTIEGIDIWRFNTAVEYNHLVLLCNVNLHCSATLWLTAYSDNIVICMSLGVHTKCLVPNFVTGELLYVLMNKNWPDKVNTPHGWAIVFWQSSLSPLVLELFPLVLTGWAVIHLEKGWTEQWWFVCGESPLSGGFIANLLKS